ncbi:MAG: hypothetical protein KDD56_05050 [Bdellovibrionales bacterium]|nr:hypothetical protein [Bdellovibrionales bacterium]
MVSASVDKGKKQSPKTSATDEAQDFAIASLESSFSPTDSDKLQSRLDQTSAVKKNLSKPQSNENQTERLARLKSLNANQDQRTRAHESRLEQIRALRDNSSPWLRTVAGTLAEGIDKTLKSVLGKIAVEVVSRPALYFWERAANMPTAIASRIHFSARRRDELRSHVAERKIKIHERLENLRERLDGVSAERREVYATFWIKLLALEAVQNRSRTAKWVGNKINKGITAIRERSQVKSGLKIERCKLSFMKDAYQRISSTDVDPETKKAMHNSLHKKGVEIANRLQDAKTTQAKAFVVKVAKIEVGHLVGELLRDVKKLEKVQDKSRVREEKLARKVSGLLDLKDRKAMLSRFDEAKKTKDAACNKDSTIEDRLKAYQEYEEALNKIKAEFSGLLEEQRKVDRQDFLRSKTVAHVGLESLSLGLSRGLTTLALKENIKYKVVQSLSMEELELVLDEIKDRGLDVLDENGNEIDIDTLSELIRNLKLGQETDDQKMKLTLENGDEYGIITKAMQVAASKIEEIVEF